MKGLYRENGRTKKSKKEVSKKTTRKFKCSKCEYQTFMSFDVEFGEEGRCPDCGGFLVEAEGE